jgi:photosystem II stability/assembly factor-like uncharacterized protein
MPRGLSIAVTSVLLLVLGHSAAADIDPDLLAGMKARSIGPAGMSGRVASIDAVASDPDVVFVGAATGGVWKSVNGGLTWKPLLDDQPVAAIGAVRVFQPNPDIVWVGTGEGNPRNSVSVGNGVYRSLDGGETWTHLGLENTERIHRIVLHPSDPDIVWVAAMGRAWGENEERGVFKTTDGGASWRKVLYVDERTGAADLVADPSNPNKLFAAMWDYRRWPWFFRSGGPGSGLHVTVDGGETWKKLTPEDGLPEGELGRIGIAVAPSDPSRVYALIEATDNALYASRDGGRTWKLAGKGDRVGNRPFYYADIRVDPEWPNRVYSLWSMISVSDDWGKTFRNLTTWQDAHPDNHAMWINPNDGQHMFIGNDGGVAESRDRGDTWRFVANLPLAQYYHIAVDDETPYNVYGGLQDNGSWRGPSSVWENGGIRNHHWVELGFGDGFDTRPVPGNAFMGYVMSQEGYLRRWNLRNGERKDIRPPAPEGVKLRFSWNAALGIDPLDPEALYYGSQFVHYSPDRGETWRIVSDDLTTDNPEWQKRDESGGLTPDVTGAENYTTILTIAPSPLQKGVIWVGTDDGRIHVTRDGGKSWTSVEDNLSGVPAHTWIPHIEPSRFHAGTAYVVLDDHRRSNWTPYVYRTHDFGKSWKSLATDDIQGYCLVIAEDPVERDLLFLGTEFGLYFSRNGGKGWTNFEHGLPTVGVRDLVVHPRDHDLVIGTHGRAVFVLDDVRPLRSLTKEVLASPVHLFEIPDALQYRVSQTGASRFPGAGEFRGENRPYGALITYALNVEGLPHPDDEKERARKAAEREKKRGKKEKEEEEGDRPRRRGGRGGDEGPKVKIRILGADGETIRKMDGPAKLGINRTAWNLRSDPFDRPPSEGGSPFFRASGPYVLPGEYDVVVAYEDHAARGRVVVKGDPRYDLPEADRRAKWDALQRAGALQETVADAIRRIERIRADLDVIVRKAKAEDDRHRKETGADDDEDGPNKDLLDAARKLRKSLGKVEKTLWVPPETKGIVDYDDAYSAVRYAMRNLSSTWGAPTRAQIAYLDLAESRLREVLVEVNRVLDEEVASFRGEVGEAGIGLLPEEEALTVD